MANRMGHQDFEMYKRLRDRRIEMKLSQEELAHRVGYKDRSTVAKIEAGLTDLSQSKIRAFADALGTTPTYLLYGEPQTEGSRDALESYHLEESIKPRNIRNPVCVKRDVVYYRVMGGLTREGTFVGTSYLNEAYTLPLSELHGSPDEFMIYKNRSDAMYPQIIRGDFLLVRKVKTFRNGKIMVFELGGRETVRMVSVSKDPDLVIAKSRNPDYQDRVLQGEELDGAYVLGEVVALYRPL